MKTNLTKQLDSLGILWRYGTKLVENWLYRKDYIFRETVLLFLQFCLQSYLVSTIKRNCVEITSSYEIDEIHCSSDKLMRAVVVQYAIGRFKTWTGLDIWFPKGVIFVSKDSIGFSKEVNQIRIRVRQMMYVDQFEVFCCSNRSIMAAQRSQTSRFNVGFSGRNSEPTVKQPKEVFSRKHRARTLLESYAWLLLQNSKTL